MKREWTGSEIAIVGMAGRFPGARNVAELWSNLRDGVEAIRRLSEEELDELGVDEATRQAPGYVPVVSAMDGYAEFDAPFFGINPREAETMDPQHRVLLECAWEALEDAAYDPATFPGLIGVFAGATLSTYLVMNLARNPHAAQMDPQQLIIGNAGDALATRVSYKLDLRGPSQTVQSACSTSLVAVHQACQSLLNEECDLALAGGVSVNVSHRAGYRALPGSILAPDGHCRSYDAEGAGSVFASGVGLVALKRLEDALAEGDAIRAIILGSATNNDGARKVGFTAPSVEGQARVISEALAVSGIDVETLGYLEGHGSGTALGDPIEIQAVTRAFRAFTQRKGFCAIGSVKSNLGHLDIAAGVTGLIKTILALQHGQLPPSLHFETPNPKIDFANSPVYVNAALADWPREERPRRAGVNSFGLGGTNAHVVLEEAPNLENTAPARPWQLTLLSARSSSALEAAHDLFQQHLEEHPGLDLEDVAYTTQVGRRRFGHRRALLFRRPKQGTTPIPERILEGDSDRVERPVTFLFPGLGDHYADMGRELYQQEPVFRQALDRCAERFAAYLDQDLRQVLFPAASEPADASDGESTGIDLRKMLGRGSTRRPEDQALDATAYAQPATFAVEYALAQLWRAWGIEPRSMIGYSLGEYTAACLAGVMSLEDATRIVARRAQLISELPEGAMLAVPLPPGDWLPSDLDIAAHNTQDQCVVAGELEAISTLAERLSGDGVACRRLPTTHAFHSRLLEPVQEALRGELRTISLQAPQIPFLSNVTGTWITPEEATDPDYWVAHLVKTVRFAEGVAELCREPDHALLEIGPGQTLGTLVRLHPDFDPEQPVIASLPSSFSRQGDLAYVLGALGELWLSGAEIDWQGFQKDRKCRRIPLPTYPFEHRRYWLEGGALAPALDSALTAPAINAKPTTTYARPELRNTFEAPKNEVEHQVAELWREVLGVDQVGRLDDFFELDGHSLLATQVASRLREIYGLEVTVQMVLEDATVAGMAAAVEEALARQDRPIEQHQIPPYPRPDGCAPMSFAQERMWFLDQLDPGAHIYNNFFIVRLEGPLQPDILDAALRELGRRHEVLRTTFALNGGQTIQRIGHSVRGLDEVDLSALDPSNLEALTAHLARVEHCRTFDLANGPLFRSMLLHLGDADHLLFLSLHHIISDGWSIGVLVRELAALYQAYAAGEPSPLPELAIQYADFSAWQRQWLSGETLEQQLTYWREALGDLPAPVQLPTDHPRQEAGGFVNTSVELLLGSELTSELRSLSRRLGTTLFITLLAAFKTLIYRYTGETDLAVGTPIAERNHAAIEPLIGFFLNTLVLRARPSHQLTFEAFVEQVRRTALAGYDHQDLPVERLIHALQEQGRGEEPLFNTMFLFQNVPAPLMEIGDIGLSIVEGGSGAVLETAIFDLCLVMDELGQEEGLRVNLIGNGRLFERSTILRLTHHFRNLLRGASAQPDLRLDDLPLIEQMEQDHLATRNDPWNPPGIHLLFSRQARRTPTAPAIIGEQGVLSYGELEARSNQLAHTLQDLSAGPEVFVGLHFERSHEQMIALWAVLKAGAAYVPLDPAYPEERKRSILRRTRAPIVLTSSSLPRDWTGNVRTICLDGEPIWADQPATPPTSRVATTQAAYAIFTSGSTGRPKGVVISQGALVVYAEAARRVYEIGADDRMLQFSSLSFDNSVEEIFPVLTCGGALVLRTEPMLSSAAAMLERCRAWGVTILDLPTAYWHTLGTALDNENLSLGHPIRLIMAGGEKLDPQRLPSFRQRAPGVRLLNTYGPTEATVCTSVHDLSDAPSTGPETAPIGRVLSNLTGHIVDRRGKLVPVGVPGELWIGGESVARGYLDDPRQTAERFLPDPFGKPGSRLYRSGDRVRQREDLAIDFLGRIDFQVKVRGFRIELGEIEAVLEQHPAIQKAVVLTRGENVQIQLIAWLVFEPSGSEAKSIDDIRAELESRLPAYMVPSLWGVLDVLPLNTSGKIDRAQLAKRDASAIETSLSKAPYLPPETDAEIALAAIFSEILGVAEIGVEDNLFQLGGHSLLLPQILHRVREVFGVDVPLRALYSEPTVADLAERVEDLILEQIGA